MGFLRWLLGDLRIEDMSVQSTTLLLKTLLLKTLLLGADSKMGRFMVENCSCQGE
jgi:hypothetical protein